MKTEKDRSLKIPAGIMLAKIGKKKGPVYVFFSIVAKCERHSDYYSSATVFGKTDQ